MDRMVRAPSPRVSPGGPTEEAPPQVPTIGRSVKVRATHVEPTSRAGHDRCDEGAGWRRRIGRIFNGGLATPSNVSSQRVQGWPFRIPKKRGVVLVDPTVEYPEDIKDPTTNTVLIKSGTKINPFDKVRWIRTLVFSTAPVPTQVGWVQQYLKESMTPKFVKLIISDGDVQKVMEQLHQRVYWANPLLVSRMGVGAVPSIVSQLRPASAGGGGGDS